jgi:uncharacterized membrane protein
MLLAAVRDDTYNVFLLLHILSAMVAFAPGFVDPFLANQIRQLDGDTQGRILEFMVVNARRVFGPALVLTGVLGFGLAGLSDEVFKMSQTWLVIAFLAWVAMNGLLHAVVLPGVKQLASGDESARQRVQMGGAGYSILLVVMLYLMLFKPGL